MNPDTRAHVHQLIGHLPPGQLAAIETLLESMIDDEELTEEDRRALRASVEYFRNGGEGIPLEQVVVDLGFTMEQIRGDRKDEGLTHQALADRIGGPVQQLKRYEAGSSQPTLEVIRKLATALSVSSDQLLFGKDERGPDDDLRLQFESISRFDEEEKRVVRSVLESMILKHEVRRCQSVSNGGESK